MRKNKKLLLASVAAMGALALGVGATSTFAWFQATQATSVVGTNGATGSIGVSKTTSELSYQATINVVADLSGITGARLTTWAKASGDPATYSISATASENTTLVTATVPHNVVDNSSPTYVAANLGTDTYKIPIKAYLTDTSSSTGEAGHTAAWEAGIDGLTGVAATKTVTFQYDQDVSSGALLLDTEVFFYTNANNTDAYAKANESVSGGSATQTLDINAQNLKSDGHYVTTSETAIVVGYLYVRMDGSLRQHTNSTNYTATIEANFLA